MMLFPEKSIAEVLFTAILTAKDVNFFTPFAVADNFIIDYEAPSYKFLNLSVFIICG